MLKLQENKNELEQSNQKAVPKATDNVVYVLNDSRSERQEELKAQGWCLYSDNLKIQHYLSCQQISEKFTL